MTTPAGCVDGLLAERYRFDERIAVGGMGEVWRAQDTILGRTVAVKCLKPEYVDDAEFRERFRNEARHTAGLSHPGIASVYDYGEQADPEKAAWLVMELVEGEPLSALLRRSGRLAPEQALDIVGQTALGLEAAHAAGVVHRDIKPGNLLVRPDGAVKITDFGIAWAADVVPLTRTGTVVGTAYYLSPEQASGAPVTPASDIYSLGVVAYECLAGERPFPGTNPLAVATAHLHQAPPPLPSDIPGPVRDLVLSALAKDPAGRPAHAGDFARAALALRAALVDGTELTTVTPVVPAVVAAAQAAPDATRALTQVSATAPAGIARPPRPVPTRPHDHRRAVRLASALLGVVVLGLSLRACLAPGAQRSPGTTASARPSAAPVARVTVTSAAYVGKSSSSVRTALLGLGLVPAFAFDGHGTPAGTVSSVTPTGSLARGASVTIHVVPVPPAPRGPAKHGKGKKK